MHKFCRKKMLAPHNIKSSAHTSLTVTAFWSHGNYPCIYSQRVAFNFFVFSCPGSSRTRESLEESIPPSTPYYFFFFFEIASIMTIPSYGSRKFGEVGYDECPISDVLAALKSIPRLQNTNWSMIILIRS